MLPVPRLAYAGRGTSPIVSAPSGKLFGMPLLLKIVLFAVLRAAAAMDAVVILRTL